MDESGARLVHGGVERFSDLEAVHYRNWNCCDGFQRIQSACFCGLSGHLSGNRGAGHQYLKIDRGPLSAETDANCADGAVAKNASEISDVVQETDHSVF